jgi:hypothetical protein
MAGLLTKEQKCKQIVSIIERRGHRLCLTYNTYYNFTERKQCLSTTQQKYPSTIQHNTAVGIVLLRN